MRNIRTVILTCNDPEVSGSNGGVQIVVLHRCKDMKKLSLPPLGISIHFNQKTKSLFMPKQTEIKKLFVFKTE